MNLNEIINQDNKLITKKYLEMQIEAEKIYGEKTVIFIEIGSFYEIYQANNIGKASAIAKEINIILTRKNKSIVEESETNPSLCGIPSVSLDKYLDVLTNNNWTILIVSQVGTPPNITREISKIVSPGTNVDYLKNEDYNFIGSVFIEKNKENIIYGGLSLIDLGTGKVLSFENYGTKNDKELAVDELIDILRINNCKEVILYESGFDISLKDKFSLNDKILCTPKKVQKNSLNINFQNELLKQVFNLNTFLSPIEELDMERTPNALNALTLLIEFVSEHNMKILSKLQRPSTVKNNNFLYLGNNALEQLNIINDSNKNSLLNIVNNGTSAIGKRFISDQLKNPLINEAEITKRYNLSQFFFEKSLRTTVISNLKSVYDIERLWRKINLSTANPSELHNFYSSLIEVQSIITELNNQGIDCNLFGLTKLTTNQINDFILDIENNFTDNLSLFNMSNINSSFVKPGVSKVIDNLEKELKDVYSIINQRGYKLSMMINNLDELLSSTDNPRNVKIDNVNIGFNDTEGFFFEITKNKLNGVEDLIKEEFEYSSKSLKTSIKFYFKDMVSFGDKISLLELKLINATKEYFLSYIENINIDTENIVDFISYIEFLINNAILKEKLNYSKPEIITGLNESFVEAIKLRHPIIETIQFEIFIPNNIALGKKENCNNPELMDCIFQDTDETTGIMLYGLNSAGKSSLIKSVGISIILAQAGFYVPATEFRYSLFENIFTRITGSDNIYKGLSTFAIEMLELKNIFNRANNKTLIIGDEIAHGTETVSALSIVASAVLRLTEINSLFMFSTHLHQLKDIDDVQNELKIKNMHIDVEYIENTGELIYNRTLMPGQGSSVYGLEFAKFMQMDSSFLTRAHQIRKAISDKLDGIELLTNKKRSLYNKDKFLGKCELCDNTAEEVHHIAPQRDADEKGLIDTFHKDHKANLLSVCHTCHMDLENGRVIVLGKKMTGNGLKVIYG